LNDDSFPNQGEFVELIVPLLKGKNKEKRAREHIKQGKDKYWEEKVISHNNYRYRPAGL